MIVDTHAHVVPATLLDALRAEKRLFPSVKLHDAAAPRMEICRERVGSGNFIPTNANAHAGEGPLSTRPRRSTVCSRMTHLRPRGAIPTAKP
jgi:hypothetical protein